MAYHVDDQPRGGVVPGHSQRVAHQNRRHLQGWEFRGEDSGHGVKGLGSTVEGLGFRVEGF